MYSYVGGFGPRTIEVQQAEAREAAVVHYWETRQGWKALSEFMETLKHFIRETGSILLYLYGTQATPGSHMLDPSFFQGPYRLIEETEYLDRPVSVFDDLMQARGRSSIGLPVVTRLYLARLHYHVDKIYKIIKTGRFQFAIETRHDRANVVGVENETGTLLKLAEKALNVLKRPRID